MIMIELEALNWSFQLLLYIYNMISGMSRAGLYSITNLITASTAEVSKKFFLLS